MFESVLIANRGEIARRVIRTLRRLGVRSVAVYTDADRGAPHAREADDAVRVDSYLDIEALLAACARTRAQAVHPGYGFLSERAAFARACADAGVVFVGPPADAIELMGDKVRAKAAAEAAGVPVVPSYTRADARYPLLVKAAAGGGGRGMRIVERPEDLDAAIAAAQREALAGFGDDTVFLERFLPRARHIEVQVMADRHGAVLALGERECSLQRRHQKVVEEHYFLEMNARLQVEHPVTELVTGLDLVELQLIAAAGGRLPQIDVRLDGHAIEVRVNAEDPARDFLPASGPVLAFRSPPGARVDAAVEAGSVVGTDYDSMIAKVIAHAHDRETALARLDRALADTAILGLTTNVGFLRRLLATEEVRAGAIDTGLLGRLELPPPAVDAAEVARAAALISLELRAERSGDDPFERADGWRLGGVQAPSWWTLAVDAAEAVEVAVRQGEAEVERIGPDTFAITEGGERHTWTYALDGSTLWLARGGEAFRVRRPSEEEARDAGGEGALRAPMPGQVLLVPVRDGDAVRAGDPVVVIESMKMELTISAPVDGVVAGLSVKPGDKVALDQTLATVEASA